MRIVVVSGHYPPNFVSGGSLQPQRLARGLRERGHDVHVYAGHMDEERTTLSTWDEADETGLPVHWIVTTPFEPWRDDRNYANPDVHRDFADFLARTRPDVVHLHDLQMLGGSLVRAAAESGARVVVTMHDFWWICARLFLVDRKLRPCSLVVETGRCGCEVDRSWLARRTELLAEELQHADLVLAPSASAARVLVANGVAPGRVDFDENGLPEADVAAIRRLTRHSPPGGGVVRFVYAGGEHDLKGVTVLLRAAYDLLADGVASGWELTLYGVSDRHIERLGLDLDDAPIECRPPFAPAEREAVFDLADVVVVPSIMLETHSILTREALGRGVPVVCTNTLGPEEVVTHEANGLIVPVGDHEALANEMRRLIEDPELLDTLRGGAEAPVAIRSLREQVEGLERRFEQLVASPAPRRQPHRREPRVRFVLFAVGIEGAPLRYRARLAAEAIAPIGVRSAVRYYRDPELLELVERADALYVYRVPATGQFLDVIARARQRGIPVLYDVDDLIFDPTMAPEIPALQILSPPEAEGWLYGVHRYRTTMEHTDGFVGSTAGLVRHAREVTGLPARQFDNGIGVLLGRASDRARLKRRKPGPLRVGYLSGTITHDRDWFHVEPAVVQVLERHAEVELWLAGHLPDSAALEKFAKRVKRIPFTPWLKLPTLLHDIDINIAPLEPGSRFNEAKSAIKWLEAALVDTPTIASATEPFMEAIEHGVSGYLASDLDDWVDSLDRLIDDDDLRKLVGQRGRREALLRWSPHVQGQRFLDILEEAREWPALAAARPDNGWIKAIADEPFAPIALEPYTASRLAGLRKAVDSEAGKARWLARRVERSIDERGAAATAAKVPRAITVRARGLSAKLRASRGAELAAHTRVMLRERGPVSTLTRGMAFAGPRAGSAVRNLVGIRHLFAVLARGRRAIRHHGLRGTVDLGAPVLRHHVMHGTNVARARFDRLRAFVSARLRR